MRHLLRSTIRAVTTESAYRTAWQRVSGRITALGGRAWAFRSLTDPNRHIEFLEWKQSDDAVDLLADVELSTALAQLDDFGRGTVETWVEQ